ncbi:nuclear GTPase SLIP-GC-like isoform X1 [Onychostoma macrolepis]|uniref:nuclear GTPase SLIP-GC-like isoform X1 n=1 Tax=Onychostoma macrolepis TaxID=369639 RepID=UPI002729616E|nr:nuclear GTPase SLIP-GC-like isoform X1 [Onychostoma macrolepis]XP_058609385.1 nuclear GTPase SLIP-GC-like isoform X1 [Onychostoma macrolepis]
MDTMSHMKCIEPCDRFITAGDTHDRTTMYAVVTLQDSDEVMVAPSNWLSEDKKQCYWPPFKSTGKYLEAVKNHLEPSTGKKPWEKIAILFHSEYGTYEQAKEKQAAMTEEKEQPVKTRKQVVETSPLSPVLSQSALSGISTHGILSKNIHHTMVNKGIKRKREPCDLHTSAKFNSDIFVLKMVKQIMAEVKIRIQNINSTVQTTIEQKNNILDAIAKMNDIMDEDNKRKETIGVFGKTGEGKSSLLNAILGLDYLLPSGSFGACTSVVTQVEANQTDSNYTAEIELISKEEWENEISSTDSRDEERITAVYGADADKKTLEELKKDDKYAEIDNLLSTMKKTISHTEVSEFRNDVACYIQHNASGCGGCYWPLVKSVTIKIPGCHELLEHIVLLDIPGTGDCNKIRDDLWKTKLRECSSVWVVSDIIRAITDGDPWGIIQHCIQDLGPGGECKNINFICTRTDVMYSNEYLRSERLSGDEISVSNLKTWCILHRNNRAKEIVKKKFENLENMKSKARFIPDVFTVSSKTYLDKNPHLEPIKTEIPKLQEVLKNTNKRIKQELTRDYVNAAKGVLSFVQSIQLDTDEKMVEIKGLVRKNLQENLAKALKELNCQFDLLYKIMDQCLSKGVEKSVKLCVDSKNSMIASVAPNDKRGFHKTLQALYKNKGCYWPKNRDAPLDLNMCLAEHMHDNIDAEFNLIFLVDDNNKSGMSVQEQIDKFGIIQSGTAYSPSSMLYHMENFIKTEETKVKALLKREVVDRKKKIYSSIQTTIQNQMTAGYEQAAKLKGNNAMKKREKKITQTIELLKHSMFKDAKMEVLNQFMELRKHICKTLKSELNRSVESSLSQTTKTTLMDVSSEIEKLERLSRQLSD